MQVKTLVTTIIYIFIAIVYYYSLDWFINTPDPKEYDSKYLDKQFICFFVILFGTLSWFIPLIKYITLHWDDNINLNKFKW